MGVFYMFDNGKKTIGVFISQLNTDFQTSLSKGITERAKELDYNVMFLQTLVDMVMIYTMQVRF